MKVRILFVMAGLLGMLLTVQSLQWTGNAGAAETVVQAAAEENAESGSESLSQAEKVEKKVEQLRSQTDALMEKGKLQDLKEVVELYEEVLASHPDNFEFNWKCAKACRLYGDLTKRMEKEGWKDICAEYGKKGMKYAKKAIELEPDKPNGYYYYGLCVGTYSDGVGLITALREGLKDKTQNNLEKAYEIDKHFENGGPIVAFGRFWQVVPWPYNDEDKAMEYYREFQETEYYETAEGVNARVYMAEILADRWGSEPKEEARQLLNEAIELTDNPYWEKRAEELLADL
ncbi:MAG: hypothetical protein KGY56_02940 [Desulfobacterales bacterium]|nr:hypothetical protein [Desulfobacterales bacterium]